MTKLINRLLANDKIRYLIAGGCTTLVNIISFFLLRVLTDIDRNVCNYIAIFAAIVFAYFANKFFVFQTKVEGFLENARELVSFFGMRIISMFIEVLSFALLCDSFRVSELPSKIAVQFIVVVVNYVFSKLFVFKEKKLLKEKFKENMCCYIAFAIVAVIMLAVYIAEDITPFGHNAVTLVDSYHQYLPFYSEYRHKLLNEGSLFYSWNIALGSNFTSLFAYYLSSPFNFLFILFDKEHIATCICLTVAIKIALSASAMTYFLQKRQGEGHKGAVTIALGVSYAFCTYVLGYFWNFMWMDCIMIFPLVMLGFEKLMEEKDPKLYCLTLFYCLYCNYYIGYMVCLFLVIWFFFYNHHTVKKFFGDGIRFAVCSLTGGGMAAFLLLPAYKGISTTEAAGAIDIPIWNWYVNIFEYFKQAFFLTEPINCDNFDGNVNLYCGMFTIFALMLFVFSGRIKLLEKFRYISLLAILMVSFNSEKLNYIWHGLHDQYGIPNRFAFLYVFIMLIIADEVLSRIGKMHIIYVLSALLFTVGFIILVNTQCDGIEKKILVSSISIVVVYGIVCALRSCRVFKDKGFSVIFTVLCVAEICTNAVFGFFESGYANLDSSYETTPNVTAAYDYVKELEENNDAGFYRAELVKSTVLDEATWHNMPSVGTFCSTVNNRIVSVMGRLGFYTGANEFLYMGSNPFTNALLNVRYVLERDGDFNNFDFDYIDTIEGVSIYENPYPTSIGFAAEESIKEWDKNTCLQLETQNNMARYLTGEEEFMHNITPELYVTSDDAAISSSGNQIDYTLFESGSSLNFMAEFYIPEDGDFYINCRGNYVDNIRFYIDDVEQSYDRYQVQIYHLGELLQGQKVTVEYEYNSVPVDEEVASIYLASFDREAFEKVYQSMVMNMLELDSFEDGYLRGHIDMPDYKTLFLSVPYDEGWKVYVDGKETKIFDIGRGFTGVDMAPGEHEIEMIYTPEGLWLGIGISVLAWIAFLLMIMNNSNKKEIAKLVKNNKNEIDRPTNI